MSSILFTDAGGTWRLHNGKPFPASRFQRWTPESMPVGDSVARLSDGAVTMLRLRDDFGVTFELPMIPSLRSNNLLVRSEEFDNASWVKNDATVSADAITAPDGSTTMDSIQETATNAVHLVRQSIVGLADNTAYTLSFHLREGERGWALLQLQGKDGTFRYAYVNLATGAFGNTSGLTARGAGYSMTIQGRVAHRFWIAATIGAGGATPSADLYIATADLTSAYLGTAGSGIRAWGAQLEVGSGPPSPYLYTQGAARAASMLEVADRLRYHLLNGGTCTINTNDAVASAYATCGLKPGTVPQIALSDRRTMEYTLSLQLINLAGSPSRMLAHFAEQ